MPSARTLLIVLCFLAAAQGCAASTGLSVPPTATPTAATIPATEGARVSPLPYEACGWAWAEQALPEISSAFRAELTATNLSFIPEGTYAYAWGENCLRADGTVDHFATLETDFVVTTTPADPQDFSAMGSYAGAVFATVLDDFGPSVVPGPQRGSVRFVIIADGDTTQYQVLLSDAETVLERGLSGAELYEALFR